VVWQAQGCRAHAWLGLFHMHIDPALPERCCDVGCDRDDLVLCCEG
jgi:hypothetical protein